ncbi:MAG: hypothetical protein JO057_17965 [Chloroflexi bacterium]|nr:hypothetical protein [Chloroflexota bacterium]
MSSRSPEGPPPRFRFGRTAIFALVCCVCIAGAFGYTLLAASRSGASRQAPVDVASSSSLAAVASQPHLVFVDGSSQHVALVPLDAPDSPRSLTSLACQRVYFAADQGLCLGPNGLGVVDSGTYSFDANFQVTHTYPEQGLPSRVRLSPAGTLGATTVFVAGDSYNSTGFSTRTTLLDTHNGVALDDLENFSTFFNGRPFQSVDFNYWGVTFANDNDTFYATLSTNGHTYLVRGTSEGSAEIVRENAECPSLSPDNTRLVFKKRISDDPLVWRLAVIDVATLTETWAGTETRSVDDQVEWLDNDDILYGVQDPTTGQTDIWTEPLDGSAQPRMFLANASSPAVVGAAS